MAWLSLCDCIKVLDVSSHEKRGKKPRKKKKGKEVEQRIVHQIPAPETPVQLGFFSLWR